MYGVYKRKITGYDDLKGESTPNTEPIIAVICSDVMFRFWLILRRAPLGA